LKAALKCVVTPGPGREPADFGVEAVSTALIQRKSIDSIRVKRRRGFARAMRGLFYDCSSIV